MDFNYGVDSDGIILDIQGMTARFSKRIRAEMGDTWREDPKFLERHFPINSRHKSKYLSARRILFNNREAIKRWKGIPSSPRSISSLRTPLRTLMNGILYHYDIHNDFRLVLDTHSRRAAIHYPPSVSPPLFLVGVGPEFLNTFAELPRGSYPSGIAPLEVMLNNADTEDARDRLAAYAHQLFQHQDNRRFVYSLIITEDMFTVYMFDHSGVVASEPCNYHEHAEQFCTVISGLASKDAQRVGFDTTIFADGPHAKIGTLEPGGKPGSMAKTYYVIKSQLFRPLSLVGRGTFCWRVCPEKNPDFVCVVKDAWIAPLELVGRESEGSLLRHAQDAGVISGIAQVHHFEEVRLGRNRSILDSVLQIRSIKDATPEERKFERVHTRIVITTHGKTFDRFTTRKELLLAYHDAVVAHRNLHDVAGILHRDISFMNILINSDGAEGNRGVLIDFDHAIRVGDTSPYSSKTKIGTWRYMSRNVLRQRGPHTYLDDLESFYYVLGWILAKFKCPRILTRQDTEYVDMWDSPNAHLIKHGQFGSPFELPVSPWFGESLRQLAFQLHLFFGKRSDLIGKPLASLNPTKDYDEFLGHIRKCITALDKEGTETQVLPSLRSKRDSPEMEADQSAVARKRARTHSEEAPELYRARLRSHGRKPVPVYKRNRRGTANYQGFPHIR